MMRSERRPFDFKFPSAILRDLDTIMKRTDDFLMRKDDVSTTAGIIRKGALGIPHDLWLKRFNTRGPFDHLRKIVFGSRAKRLFETSRRLHENGLPVPLPVAYFEPTFRRRHSYYLSSVIENSENLLHAYKGRRELFADPDQVAAVLGRAVAEWHKAGAVHGDLKWGNILLRKSAGDIRVFFVDLDQAAVHPRPNIKGIRKDLGRFYRYGLDLGAKEWMKERFFSEYAAAMPGELMDRIDLDSLRGREEERWRARPKSR